MNGAGVACLLKFTLFCIFQRGDLIMAFHYLFLAVLRYRERRSGSGNNLVFHRPGGGVGK